MIRLQVQTNGIARYIDTVATALEDLEAPIAEFNAYKRKEVQARFDSGGPGWPATKSGTSAKSNTPEAVKQLADHMLRKKLVNDLRRAKRKYARGGSSAAMERRYKVLQAFDRIAAGGEAILPFQGPGVSKEKNADARLDKSLRGLQDRHARAYAKAQSRPLGRIASSIKSKLTKSSVTIFSEVSWSAVHNDGGTAGHGAKIPKRQFLEVTDEDVSVLTRLIEEHTRFSL